jgi:hypothetical protein
MKGMSQGLKPLFLFGFWMSGLKPGPISILYRSGKRVKPEELNAFLKEASVVAGSFFGLGSFWLRGKT